MTVSRVGIIARATNGQRGIGSGYDCDVVRTPDGALIACLYEVPMPRRQWLLSWEPGEWDREPQLLADYCANGPNLSDGDWIAQDSDAWEYIAGRWDAAMEEAYERRMEGTEGEE